MVKVLLLLITVAVVALDQVTKRWITTNMELGESNVIVENFLYITYHRNSGAAWGILQDWMIFFYVITVIAVIGILVWLYKLNIRKNRVLAVALVIILGGALGNFVDRVMYRSVIDFIHTVWWGYNFPIFNVADMALVCGVILMMIDVIFIDRKKSKDLYFKMDR